MMKILTHFTKSEDGAVTVDWVVLTASVVGLAAASFFAIKDSSGTVGTFVKDFLVAIPIG